MSSVLALCARSRILCSLPRQLISTAYSQLKNPKSCKLPMENVKPPNVFIYTGENGTESKEFSKLKTVLEGCLNREKYVIYHLQSSRLHSSVWEDNTIVLVVSCNVITEPVKQMFQNYITSGGRLLCLRSDVSVIPGIHLSCTEDAASRSLMSFSYGDWHDIISYRTPFQLTYDENGPPVQVLATECHTEQPVIIKCSYNLGIAVIAKVLLAMDAIEMSTNEKDFQVLKEGNEKRLLCLKDILSMHIGLDCSVLPVAQLTRAVLFHRPDGANVLACLYPYMENDILKLQNLALKITDDPAVPVSSDIYPVTIATSDSRLGHFDRQLFDSHLQTSRLGSIVFYSDTVTSTMDFLEGLPVDVGAVSITRVQVKGKGRGGNAWLSPRGCAMFSIQVCVDYNSPLGQALPFIQQMATLAVILAIKTIPGSYQDLDLGMKWPNDLYYAKKVKFGGILAKSTMRDKTFHCYIGYGIDLDNSQPTVCLNDLIAQHNRVHGTHMEPVKLEVLAARTISHLEQLVDRCQKQGPASCLQDLYSHWIHQDQRLTLEEIGEEVVVKGVDECGFLRVQTAKGQFLTLHPDENSLDQMKNLLIAKFSPISSTY